MFVIRIVLLASVCADRVTLYDATYPAGAGLGVAVYVGYGTTVGWAVAVGTVVGICVAEGNGVGVANICLVVQQQQPLMESARLTMRIMHKSLPFISILLEILYSLSLLFQGFKLYPRETWILLVFYGQIKEHDTCFRHPPIYWRPA
jgi:hypothetical protein